MSENDALTKWVVDFSRSKVIAKAARNVEKTIHLTNRIILSENQYVLLDALPRVFPRLSVFAQRLEAEGYSENSLYIYSWMTFCMDLAIKLAKRVDKENFLAEMIVLNSSYKLNTGEAQQNIDKSFELSKFIKVKCSEMELMKQYLIYERL